MEKRFHARTSTSSSTFPSPSGRPSPQSNSSHTFGPPVSCFPPTLFCLSVVPPSPQIAALQPLQEDPPTPGWFAIPRPCFPARFPAPLHHQRRPASRYPGVLRYRGTSFFFAPHLSGAAGVGALLHAPSVQRPASCRPAPSRLKHTQPPPFASREPRARSPISPIRLRLCVPVQFSPGHPTTSSPPPQVPAVSRHFYISMSIDPRPTTTTRLNSTARSEKGQPVFPVSSAPVIPPTILSTSLVGKETDPTNLVAAPSPGANITATPTPAHPDPRR